MSFAFWACITGEQRDLRNGDLRKKVDDLLRGVLEGRIMEMFEKYYADEVVMSENGVADPARVGKANNRSYEEYFANNVRWEGPSKLLRVSVDEQKGHVAYEMSMEFSINGRHISRTQVAFQTWKNGFIVKEDFYYKD